MQQQALSLTTKSLEKGEHNGKEADKKVRGVFYGSDLCRGGRTGDCATYYAGRTEGRPEGLAGAQRRPYRHENAEICLKHSETNRRSSRYSLCFRRRN